MRTEARGGAHSMVLLWQDCTGDRFWNAGAPLRYLRWLGAQFEIFLNESEAGLEYSLHRADGRLTPGLVAALRPDMEAFISERLIANRALGRNLCL